MLLVSDDDIFCEFSEVENGEFKSINFSSSNTFDKIALSYTEQNGNAKSVSATNYSISYEVGHIFTHSGVFALKMSKFMSLQIVSIYLGKSGNGSE